MAQAASTSEYVMGHTDRERRRLALQGSVLNPITEDFLRRAGISAGMRVLDLGCGVGDVSMIAGRLVGISGRVTGIDIDADALEIARGRAAGAGLGHVTFEKKDCQEALYSSSLSGAQPDAVIGRHVLIHMRDPLEMIRRAAAAIHDGGILAFQEYDFSTIITGFPEVPLAEQTKKLFERLFKALGLNAQIGAQLFHLMQAAGLSKPECRLEALIDGGPDSPFYELMAETFRSILPRLESLGIATQAEIDIDTLAERLRNEALSRKAGIVGPPMVGAFARKRPQ